MHNKIVNVATVIDYIEEHLAEKLSLEIVAKAVCYSKYHLHRIFTDTVGLSLHEYIQRRRLTEAAKLLVFSDKPIIEIALIAGYESQQAFTTIFKSMYKTPPYQYRGAQEFYPLQLRYVLHEEPTKIETAINWKEDITFATPNDIAQWMVFVTLVVDGFPRLREDKHLAVLRRNIEKRQAMILKDGDIIIGAMAFNNDTGSIDFLAVHPQYNKKAIAKAFLKRAFSELLKDAPISITTFRKGDKADPGYRAIFQILGFAEAELLIEFGYPTQKLILHKKYLEADENDSHNRSAQ